MPVINVHTYDGKVLVIDAESVLFVRKCPHCGVQFTSENPRKIHPNNTHKQRHYEQRIGILSERSGILPQPVVNEIPGGSCA